MFHKCIYIPKIHIIQSLPISHLSGKNPSLTNGRGYKSWVVGVGVGVGVSNITN